jgi:hypothetical protein
VLLGDGVDDFLPLGRAPDISGMMDGLYVSTVIASGLGLPWVEPLIGDTSAEPHVRSTITPWFTALSRAAEVESKRQRTARIHRPSVGT